MTKKLILASGSPRRQDILKQISLPFSVRKPDIDESQIQINDPKEKVQKLAKLKSEHTLLADNNEVILSADTVVSYKNNIFEKPIDKEDAFRMISMLSGSIHEVYTGVTIRSVKNEITLVEKTEVAFWPLSKTEIEWYVSTEEPYDKAGSYGIQSMGAMFAKKIIGDYYNVVGLPVSKVARELRSFSIFPK
ncbi:nucleoside triphosphate pyrophosphatase [Virgibacillus oceani]